MITATLDEVRDYAESRIKPGDLERFCTRALAAGGLSSRHAAETAEVLVTTDTWGTFTHGTRQILPLLKNVRTGVVQAKAEPAVAADGPAWVLVDGNDAISMVTSRLAMNLAMEKARESGIGFAGVRGSGHYGAAGYYAMMAAEKDMIGLSVCNVDRRMSIPGSRGAVMGTNPLAYAVPAGQEKPVFMDIATSIVAASKVITARVAGTTIPDNWLVDERGLPTSDPSTYPERSTVVPLAAHKGYGIALFIEILSGVLTGSAFLSGVGNWLADVPERTDQGHAFIAIDVDAMMPIDRFKERMDAMIREVRGAPKAEGVDRIYLPGEMEWEKHAESHQAGMLLPDYVLLNLFQVAQETDLTGELETSFDRLM